MQTEQTDFKPTSLDDILTTDQTEPAAQPELETAESVTGDKPPEPDAEQAADSEDTTPPPVVKSDDGDQGTDLRKDLNGLRDALLAERNKRQAIERQLQQQQSQQQQTERPSFDEDPEGYLAAELYANRVIISQDAMRSLHDDYDEMETVFADAMAENPALQMQLGQSPNPAKFAYEQGKRISAMREIGDDPNAYKDKLRAELKAELLSELKAELRPEKKPVVNPPTSLADVPAAADNRNGAKWAGPTPLEAILSE